MFSPDIVCSDDFLDMPASSRELYFQLGMRADDDGFVQPRVIMRTIGASADDLKVLLTKRFLLPFESGVVVVKHWLIHNMIRLDRYKPTRFQEEKKALFIKENNAYTDKEIGKKFLATKRQPNVNQSAPQVRLGKVRLSKDRLEHTEGVYSEDFVSFWNSYPKKVGKGDAYKSFTKANLPPLDELLKAVESQISSDQWQKENGRYIPNPATWLNQRRWEDDLTITKTPNKFSKYDS